MVSQKFFRIKIKIKIKVDVGSQYFIANCCPLHASKQEHYILKLVVSYLQYVIIKYTSLTFNFTSRTHSIS